MVFLEFIEKGMCIDYWKMDLFYVFYFFMLVIGEFVVVEEKWEDIFLSYYVELEYEVFVKDIFGYILEMLGFFLEKLGLKYFWLKYV